MQLPNPVVLSREEIDLIFDHLDDSVNLIAKVLYGCGLRLFECLNLRVHNLNFDAGILTIHDGKGMKDRTVPIPQAIVPALKQQLQKVTAVHEADLKAKFTGTFLPDQLDLKYKNAAYLAMVISGPIVNFVARNAGIQALSYSLHSDK